MCVCVSEINQILLPTNSSTIHDLDSISESQFERERKPHEKKLTSLASIQTQIFNIAPRSFPLTSFKASLAAPNPPPSPPPPPVPICLPSCLKIGNADLNKSMFGSSWRPIPSSKRIERTVLTKSPSILTWCVRTAERTSVRIWEILMLARETFEGGKKGGEVCKKQAGEERKKNQEKVWKKKRRDNMNIS